MSKANLNREVIVQTAAVLADQEGIDQVSMAAIARQLGVTVPSLYKHVSSLPAVHRELAVRAMEGLIGEVTDATSGGEPGTELANLANAYRRYATEHPGLYAASTRGADPSDEELVRLTDQLLEVISRVLVRRGMRRQDWIHDVRMLRSALHGCVALEASGNYGPDVNADDSFKRLIDGLDAALGRTEQPWTWPLA